MSSKRAKRIAARLAAATGVLVTILGLMCTVSACNPLDQHIQIIQSTAGPTCMPIAGTGSHTPIPPKLTPVQLQVPDPADLTWSCPDGNLFYWTTSGFQPFRPGHQMCRFAESATGSIVDYRIKPASGSCSSGKLAFRTKPDRDNQSYWFDPDLNYWLRISDNVVSTLEGDTLCHGWQPIYIDTATGGPFFSRANQACLKDPGSLRSLRAHINLWTGPPGFSWFIISQAPVCSQQYKRPACATLP